MADLTPEQDAQVHALCEEGDGLVDQEEYDDALEAFYEALALLPEPKTRWDAAGYVMASIADVYFLTGEDAQAVGMLELALRCPGADQNAFVHLRLGQSLLELGENDRAVGALARAYQSGGDEIFEDEDPRYFAFLMANGEPPPGGW